MKKILILAGLLMAATAAHAQGFGGAGLSAPTFTNNLSSIGNLCTFGTGATDPRSSTIVAGKNDGVFQPTSYQSYEQAIAEGIKIRNAQPASLGEVARQAREDKKAAKQTAVLIVSQDDRGNMTVTARP